MNKNLTNKKQEDIWREILYSSDIEAIKDTLEEIGEKGDVKILPDIIKIYKGYKNTKLQTLIYNFLCDIKSKDSASVFIDFIDNKEYSSIKKDLVSVCWQSSIDFSEYYDFFVDIFLKSPIDVAFEAFTVLENMPDLNPEIVEKIEKKLQVNISKITEDKKELLIDLVNVIRNKKAEI